MTMPHSQSAAHAREQLVAASSALRWGSRFLDVPDRALARRAAVLVLFGVLDDVPATSRAAPVARDLDVLLQRRAPTVSSHAGEVSFPGGRRDPHDLDPVATALREAREETGLESADVEVLGALPEAPLLASNHVVTPVLAWWRAPSKLAAVDHAETIEVLRVPVAQLLDPASRFTAVVRFTSIDGPRTLRAPAFEVDGLIVWGFTATVLDEVFDAAGWTLPWDASIERVGRPGNLA